jgi:hypothetical protein
MLQIKVVDINQICILYSFPRFLLEIWISDRNEIRLLPFIVDP